MSASTDVAGRQESLASALDAVLGVDARAWMQSSISTLSVDPATAARVFAAAGRFVGRRELISGDGGLWDWTTDEAARALLLAALPSEQRDETLRELYRYGDRHERSAVLRALDVLPATSVTHELVIDALRTNDQRIVAAALSPTGVAVLDEPELVQAVLKCVFMGLDLAALPLADHRITPELSRALTGYARERVAAGRTVPESLWPPAERHLPNEVGILREQIASTATPEEQA